MSPPLDTSSTSLSYRSDDPTSRENLRVVDDPPAWSLSVPDVTITDTQSVIARVEPGVLTDRVSLWVTGLTAREVGAIGFAEFEFRGGLSWQFSRTLAVVTKNLAPAAAGPVPWVFQVAGVRAATWTLYARLTGVGGNARVSVRLALLGDQSACCDLTVITP